MNVVIAHKNLCRGSYRCVRACPVKAIRICAGKAEIVAEKCIGCGACIGACAQKAITVRNDLDVARQLLATDRVVAILAPEYVAAFDQATPEQVEAGLERLGFYSVEEAVLGEELVAMEYERMLLHLNGDLVIRSTCPSTVAWLERYHPGFVADLAPLISPMIAQGRLVKAIYDDPVKTAYIGPCVARKAEAADEQVADAIDVVLTFDELKQFLDEQGIDLAKLPPAGADQNRPVLFKAASLVDGFPRDVLARRSMVDTDVKVIRGAGAISRFVDAVDRGEAKPKIIDVSQCEGCIDGPAMATSQSVFARKNAVATYYLTRRQMSSAEIHFSDLRPRLPRIATARGFTARPVGSTQNAEELQALLDGAERLLPEEQLDCGACGYDTCREQAMAVSQGLAEWEMCHPLQKKLLLQLVDRLRDLSATDGLTGLVNHRTFSERLEEELHRFRRYGNPLSVLMIDVDLFKLVNDSLGHVAGDDALKAVAEILADSMRGSDILSRWGGDEFAAILPVTDKTQAFAVAEKLRTKIEQTAISVPFNGNESTLRMTISVGVAASSDEKTADQIVTEADRALYLAKTSGRNRTELGGGTGAPDAPALPEEA